MREVNDNSNKMNEENQVTTEYCSINRSIDDHLYSDILKVASECTKTSEVAADMTCMNPDENVLYDNITNPLHLIKR